MGFWSSLFGGEDGAQGSDSANSGRSSSSSDDQRCTKDGTCFQDAVDGKHVVITRQDGGAPSVGHN
jgi:hypothetical protein